jgi:hypothetical protein
MTETMNIQYPLQGKAFDSIFENIGNVLVGSIDLDDCEKLILLRRVYEGQEEKEYIFKGVVRYLMTPEWETTLPKEESFTWEIEEIAKKFSENYSLFDDLVNCLNQAQIIFSDLQSLVAQYDCFNADDYEEDGYIVIRIEVGSDRETAFAQEDALNKWMLENIDDDKINYFVLVVSRTI